MGERRREEKREGGRVQSFQGFANSVEEKDQLSFAQKNTLVIGQFEKI